MLSFSVPPGYRRSAPPRRPKLGPFTGIIDRILEDDRTSHRKQRHTAKRIFDRLRDEYGFTGGYTIVKDLSLPFIPSIAETLEFCITTGYPGQISSFVGFVVA